MRRLLRVWRTFWAWFTGRRLIIRELTDTGYVQGMESEHKYRLRVEPVPDKGTVFVGINIVQHPILNRWRLAQPVADQMDFLFVEVEPDEVEAAKTALVRDADRRVKSIQTAWEHGWRPVE